MTVALIDGEFAAYRCSSVAYGPYSSRSNCESTILGWVTEAGCDKYIICFSGGKNFRKDIFPSYKLNRKNTPKPEHYESTVQWFKDNSRCTVVAGMESDDIMGIIGTTSPKDTVIITIDKDLKTVPCRVYNPIKKVMYEGSEESANRFWMLQTLTGDTSDGYAGCPGVGPKGAEKFLEGAKSIQDMWQAVIKGYKSKGLNEEDALVQARLARILRKDDYLRKEKQILLWHPTSPVPFNLPE